MTELQKRLRENAAKEQMKIPAVAEGRYRCRYHLMPPVGWMNDPNGLCYANGLYHVFFQYAPESARGTGMRSWGHYAGTDLLHWTFYGVAIYPDTEWDEDGAYSGSALPDGKGLRIYYTGNIKRKDKEYDYISDGRESNTILIRSEDGFTFGEKQVLLRACDYPEEFTRHIRDPKVEKTPQGYRMVLGGRLKGDTGAILVYESQDGIQFSLQKVVTTPRKFGYMWECPDLFSLNGKQFVCVSPQGVPHERYKFQSVYSSGYFVGEADAENYREWDCGFDFYAPQTFWDGNRRILYGWIGMPDVPYDNVPTIAEGWQHALTMPRELTEKKGKLYQMPAAELKNLRGCELSMQEECTAYNLELENISAGTKVLLSDALEILFEKEECVLRFLTEAGRGRTERRGKVCAEKASIFMDVSVCEIYVNDGECVFTTRLYPEKYAVKIEGGCTAKRYEMNGYTVGVDIQK